MLRALSYDDVLLVPQYSDIESRKDVDISSILDAERNLHFSLPIISSPMDTITEEKMAIALARMGGLGIVHRYNTVEKQSKMAEIIFENISPTKVGFAIGITGDYLERATELYSLGARILCLDVAHGDHILMQRALNQLRDKLGDKPHLMAGNVATLDSCNRLAVWGANSIRVGIGGGCFVPNTLVNTENGLKKIEDIKVGDKVFSHTGRLQPVIDTLTYHKDEEIISVNGIDCTKNHEFYILDKENVNCVKEDNIHLFARWVHAEELDMEKHLLIELE
jgi:IMP dehydrogenase/GMP reductase